MCRDAFEIDCRLGCLTQKVLSVRLCSNWIWFSFFFHSREHSVTAGVQQAFVVQFMGISSLDYRDGMQFQSCRRVTSKKTSKEKEKSQWLNATRLIALPGTYFVHTLSWDRNSSRIAIE